MSEEKTVIAGEELSEDKLIKTTLSDKDLMQAVGGNYLSELKSGPQDPEPNSGDRPNGIINTTTIHW
jgi:hypothetical protein